MRLPASWIAAVAVATVALTLSPAAVAATAPPSAIAWWVWPIALFVVSFLLGIVALPAGVGGGVLFVPIVNGFFPFHLDFVRGAGLLVALASALSAGPNLLRGGLADLRLALPLDRYLAATGTPTGWGWSALLGRGEFASLVGIAVLAGCSALCLLAIIPLYLRRRDFVYAVACVLEIAVLVLAASGILTSGH